MWENDLVFQLEMLGQRQGTPRWTEEPVWWLLQRLGNMEGLGIIHNNKRHILGFEQSLTGAWKKHLKIWTHCLPPETS